MQDILPPKRSDLRPQNRKPQQSQRLQGHTLDSARQRLLGGFATAAKPTEPVHTPPAEEPDEPSTEQAQARRRLRLHRPRPMDWWRAWGRPRKIITVFVTLLLLTGAASIAGYSFFWRVSEPELYIVKHHPKPPSPPTTVASPLTGAQVTPEDAARPVTGVMIENSPDARPQSGIQDAGVVFEAIAEGGITRFLTLYQEARPDYVGPVRSLRPYYIDFAVPFDASIAHVGGSPDALAQIRSRAPGMKDLDQFFNSGSYWRVSTRYAPHNVYTSFDKLDALNAQKGFTTSNVQVWPRKVEKKVTAVPTAKSINLNISSYYYNNHYEYDAATNSYLRSEGGAAHLATTSQNDAAPQQLHPKVVIALVVPYSIVDSAGHSGYNTNGSGEAYVFQDGGVTVGSWSKTSRASQFAFKDSAGADIKLNPGQTWVTLLAKSSLLSYTP